MHLVEERRVEQRAVGASPAGNAGLSAVDLEAPRQVGGQAEQLLVEPVAEPADRLREQQAGGERVGEGPEPDAGPCGSRSTTPMAPPMSAP